MTICTHSSNWWKEMTRCVVCGAEYNDEEADNIAYHSSDRQFSPDQLAQIARIEAEEDEF
jgi:hypothetical protein